MYGWDRRAGQQRGQGGDRAESGFALSFQCWSLCFQDNHLLEMLGLRAASSKIGRLAPRHTVRGAVWPHSQRWTGPRPMTAGARTLPHCHTCLPPAAGTLDRVQKYTRLRMAKEGSAEVSQACTASRCAETPGRPRGPGPGLFTS